MAKSARGKQSPQRHSARTPENDPPVEIEFVFGALAGAENDDAVAKSADAKTDPAKKDAAARVRFRFGSVS